MSKHTKQEQAEAIAQLREWIRPGDTVYTILDHVSASGMSRAIRVCLPYVRPSDDQEPSDRVDDSQRYTDLNRAIDFIHPNYAVGKALGLRHWKRNGREQDALVVGGCGMDMGFHLVYELSHLLYGSRRCTKCLRYIPDDYPTDVTCGECDGDIVGGYACLGKGKCPSNYHANHRTRVRCDGFEGRFCWKPDRYSSRFPVPEDWPTGEPRDIGEGVTIPGPLLACLTGSGEDGQPYEVCPTCKGVGDLPNPDGPERFDLIHTDGYALRHRWL